MVYAGVGSCCACWFYALHLFFHQTVCSVDCMVTQTVMQVYGKQRHQVFRQVQFVQTSIITDILFLPSIRTSLCIHS